MEARKRTPEKIALAFISCFLLLSCSKKESSKDPLAVSVPEGWQYEKNSGQQGFTLIKGVPAQDPMSTVWAEPASMIRFVFYSTSGGLFASPAEFVKKAAPGYALRKEMMGKTALKSLEMSFEEPFPPKSVNPKLYDTRTRYVFLEQPDGFWLFEYTAVTLRYPQYLPIFEGLVRDFVK